MAASDDHERPALGYLRFDGQGGVPAEDLRRLLVAVEDGYRVAARIELEATYRLAIVEWAREYGPPFRYQPPSWGFDIGRVADESFVPVDRLLVSRVVLESPGFWEFLGGLNPLEVLRKYLNDRHERAKDRSYRSDAERERLGLENALRRLTVVERLMQLEREYGPDLYASEAWRRGWEGQLQGALKPLAELDRLGLIAGHTATAGPEPQDAGSAD